MTCAREYASGGAAALSVLTDETYFGGHLDYLARVREAVSLPLLRKDFTIDGYQIDEARVAGADAILLIVSILAGDQLVELSERARALGLDVLVEVKDEPELQMALEAGADLVGVNNRDLRTFEVDLGTTARLARRISSGTDLLLVSESGIEGPDDLQQLARAGAGAFLVGESLMRQPDLVDALRARPGKCGVSAWVRSRPKSVTRPSGWVSACTRRFSLLQRPGQIDITATPCSSSSRAMSVVSFSTPAFPTP